jgi:hypothetical protein
MPLPARPILLSLLPLLVAPTLRAQSPHPTTAAARADILQYHHDLFLNTYDRLGHHSPHWDKPARRALAALAADWALSVTGSGDEMDTAWFAVQDALRAHCDDPLLLYLAGRMESLYGPIGDHPADFPARAAQGMSASPDYPPLLKSYCYLRAAQYLATHDFKVPAKRRAARDQAHQYFDQALALIPTLATDRSIPPTRLLDLFHCLTEVAPALAPNADKDAATDKAKNGIAFPDTPDDPTAFPLAAWHRAFDPFAKACPDPSLAHTLEAGTLLNLAWEARGQGPAADVPPDNRRRFLDLLNSAEASLDQATTEDPDNQLAATLMLQVGTAKGFSRGMMDYWFQRAVTDNPNAYDAVTEVLTYLEPRWGGSVDQMLSFARTCAATNNWKASLPLAVVDAHLIASRYTNPDYDGSDLHPVPQYFADHPAAFAEIRPIYEEYLRRHPQTLFHRTRFATLAAWSGQWTLAHQLFQSTGDKTSYRWAFNVNSLNKLRTQAKRHARAATTTTQPTPP